MNLYLKPIQSRRDPLGMENICPDCYPDGAIRSNGGWLDIGVSASSSSGANAGDSTTGSFLVGSNSTPVWVWIVAAALVLVVLLRKR